MTSKSEDEGIQIDEFGNGDEYLGIVRLKPIIRRTVVSTLPW